MPDMSDAGIWLILALILGIAELAVPGVFVLFPAIAAGITAAITFAMPALPLEAQLLSFATWSAVTVAIGRRWYLDYPVEGGDPMLNDRARRMIGEIVTVETPMIGGRGRVLVGDGGWPARGPDAVPGERLKIVGLEDGVLLVERP